MPQIGETPTEQQQHLDLVEGLEEIVRAIRAGAVQPPVVNVSVDPPAITVTPSQVVIDRRDSDPRSYKFQIHRDRQGRIDHITAEPIDG